MSPALSVGANLSPATRKEIGIEANRTNHFDHSPSKQASMPQSNSQAVINEPALNDTLRCTRAEQRQSAIGLARFKVSQGKLEKAKEIADQLNISYLVVPENPS